MARRKPPADVEIYYDRPTRAWWAFRVDSDGNQVGEAVDSYQYNDCLDAIIQREERR